MIHENKFIIYLFIYFILSLDCFTHEEGHLRAEKTDFDSSFLWSFQIAVDFIKVLLIIISLLGRESLILAQKRFSKIWAQFKFWLLHLHFTLNYSLSHLKFKGLQLYFLVILGDFLKNFYYIASIHVNTRHLMVIAGSWVTSKLQHFLLVSS